MPSSSRAQNRLMHAAASKAGGVDGVPQSVGKDFVDADAGRKIGKLPNKVTPKSERVKRLYGNG